MVGVRQERLQCCALWGLFWQRQAQPLDLHKQQEPSQALLPVQARWHIVKTCQHHASSTGCYVVMHDPLSQEQKHCRGSINHAQHAALHADNVSSLQPQAPLLANLTGMRVLSNTTQQSELLWSRNKKAAGEVLTSIKCLGKGPTAFSYSSKQGSSVVLQ